MIPETPAIPPTPNSATPAAAATNAGAAVGTTSITIDDFAKIELRVATVLEAKPHRKGTKLLVLQLDLGDGQRRQICAGIRQHVAAESLVGKQIVVVANLAPREMMGEISQGMLLAASDASGKLTLLTPSEPISAGAQVR